MPPPLFGCYIPHTPPFPFPSLLPFYCLWVLWVVRPHPRTARHIHKVASKEENFGFNKHTHSSSCRSSRSRNRSGGRRTVAAAAAGSSRQGGGGIGNPNESIIFGPTHFILVGHKKQNTRDSGGNGDENENENEEKWQHFGTSCRGEGYGVCGSCTPGRWPCFLQRGRRLGWVGCVSVCATSGFIVCFQPST